MAHLSMIGFSTLRFSGQVEVSADSPGKFELDSLGHSHRTSHYGTAMGSKITRLNMALNITLAQ